MLLRHATPARNVAGILRAGLITGKSRGRLAAVWLCSAAKSSWAVLHTIKRHGGRVETTVVLEVDVQGAFAVRESYPDAVLVFVKAPSREEQRRRLLDRGKDDPEAIGRRLAQAAVEESAADRFDAVIVNDDADRAAREVAAILESHREARPPP